MGPAGDVFASRTRPRRPARLDHEVQPERQGVMTDVRPLVDLARDEVLVLHEFFVAWFRRGLDRR